MCILNNSNFNLKMTRPNLEVTAARGSTFNSWLPKSLRYNASRCPRFIGKNFPFSLHASRCAHATNYCLARKLALPMFGSSLRTLSMVHAASLSDVSLKFHDMHRNHQYIISPSNHTPKLHYIK